MKAVKPLAWLLLLAPLQSPALSTDGEQPISVEADSLEVREQENVSIYRGNVSLTQGSLEISSDRLVIHFDDAKDLVFIEMTGTPARFRQLDDEQREMEGEARQINYTRSDSLLELIDKARFSHAGDTIESSRILINTDDNSIQAGSGGSGERVKMLIRPRAEPGASD